MPIDLLLLRYLYTVYVLFACKTQGRFISTIPETNMYEKRNSKEGSIFHEFHHIKDFDIQKLMYARTKTILIFDTIETITKKMTLAKKWANNKKSTLLNGIVILTKFHYYYVKIVDFSLLANSWARVIFLLQSLYTEIYGKSKLSQECVYMIIKKSFDLKMKFCKCHDTKPQIFWIPISWALPVFHFQFWQQRTVKTANYLP